MFEKLHFTNQGGGLRIEGDDRERMKIMLVPINWWSLKAWRFANEVNKSLKITAMAEVKQK